MRGVLGLLGLLLVAGPSGLAAGTSVRAVVPADATRAVATRAEALPAVRSWYIESFHSEVRVLSTGRVQVTERIRARFEGSFQGIFRDIPIQYRGNLNFNYRLRLTDISATDAAGNELEFETSRERHYRRVKVWVPGAQDAARTVIIRYTVENGLRWIEEDDQAWTELYWNITGDEWPVRIDEASTRIVLPSRATGVRARAFTGAYGSTASNADLGITNTVIEARTRGSLGIKEGLTVTVAWDTREGGLAAGAYVVAPPTVADRIGAWLSSNWPIFIPLLVFFLMYNLWSRFGRDPQRLAVAPRYEPPDGITVSEAGALIDNRADMRDVTAMIVDLAVRGFLKIRKEDQAKILGIPVGSQNYTFELQRGRDAWSALRAHESKLLEALFGGRVGEVTSTSDLKNSFYKDLPSIKNSLWDSLVGHGFYRSRPDHVQGGWMVAAGLVGIGGAAAGIFLSSVTGMSAVTTAVAALLSGILVGSFGALMPARTLAGARAQEQALGFEEFLNRVESDRFKRMITGPEMFERYLPFAMAFGVEDRWAAAFADIYRDQQPSWYAGPAGSRFHAGSLTGDLSGMATSTASAMQSAPRSSGGSGFSGGGGGGFSGGGFGGGGGGAF
jgi:hypothetical protein